MSEWRVMLRDREIHRFRVEPGQAVTIGRGAEADVCIDNPAVSRLHTRLAHDASGWRLTDLGSTNGTFVNGARIEGTVAVGPEDRVEVAKFSLVAVPDPAPEAAVRSPAGWDATVVVSAGRGGDRSGEAAETPRRLVIAEGRAEPGTYALGAEGVVRIGSGPACEVRVPGWLLASTQCTVRGRHGAHFVASHGRWRRTRLNGEPLRGERRLSAGDAIRIAGTTLRFE